MFELHKNIIPKLKCLNNITKLSTSSEDNNDFISLYHLLYPNLKYLKLTFTGTSNYGLQSDIINDLIKLTHLEYLHIHTQTCF